MTRLTVERYTGVDAFLATAGSFLAAREAEHNLIFGICSNLRTAPEAFVMPPLLATVKRGPTVVLVVVMTPPWNLVFSEVDDPGALPVLAEHLQGLELPGVIGPSGHATAFAALWSKRTGLRPRLAMRERIFRLTTVRKPAHPAQGSMRAASGGDRDLLARWLGDFSREALDDLDPTDPVEAADRWIAGRGRTMYLWENREIVSLCGAGGETPNGIRIGPVYTPPRFRGRGYAGSCVGAVSALQLDAGRLFCFLFTDITNPTSNHIYQEIGYEPIRDVEEFRFDRAQGGDRRARVPAGGTSLKAACKPNTRPASDRRGGDRRT